MGVFAAFSGGKIFSGFPGFSASTQRGTRTAAGGFALTGRLLFCTGKPGCANCVSVFAPDGRLLFCTDPAGHSNCRRRVRPFRAAPFPAPAERGARTASAGSPLTGGEFFAEPQRRDSPSADGGNVAAPAAGTTPYPRRWAKRKGHLRFARRLLNIVPAPCAD